MISFCKDEDGALSVTMSAADVRECTVRAETLAIDPDTHMLECRDRVIAMVFELGYISLPQDRGAEDGLGFLFPFGPFSVPMLHPSLDHCHGLVRLSQGVIFHGRG